MAVKTRKANAPVTRSVPPREPVSTDSIFWRPWALFACALLTALVIFSPALNGSFIFDDLHLPFSDPNAATAPAEFWIGGVRPVLMLTYWANFLLSGTAPYSYHLFSVILHAFTALLSFFILQRVLRLAGIRESVRLYALAGAALFLLHPLQTESVDYLAGRSEVVAGLFSWAAWLVFLRNFEGEMSVAASLQIMALTAAAVLSKENAIALPAVLLATDFFWGKRPLTAQFRSRVKLYIPFLLGGAAGALMILRTLKAGTAAGFSDGVTSFQYALTQCRVILTYVRLFLFPAGQNGDWHLPFFHSPADGAAWIYVLGMMGLLAAAVWLYKRERLASFGIVVFLLLLAPTSSFIPIKDALAERRMYMPLIGLILAVLALLPHLRWSSGRLRAVATAAVLLAAFLCWQRSFVWVDAVSLWSDSAAKNPDNERAALGVGSALLASHRCGAAVAQFTEARKKDPADFRTLWNLAASYECDKQPEKAIQFFQTYNKTTPSTDAWTRIAYNYGTLGDTDKALDALEKALQLNPNNATAYAYRGIARAALGNGVGAREDFRHALAIDPRNAAAIDGARRLGLMR